MRKRWGVKSIHRYSLDNPRRKRFLAENSAVYLSSDEPHAGLTGEDESEVTQAKESTDSTSMVAES